MRAMTLESWNAAGFRVRRGEKSSGRDATGRPTFTRDQVDDAGDLDIAPSLDEDLELDPDMFPDED